MMNCGGCRWWTTRRAGAKFGECRAFPPSVVYVGRPNSTEKYRSRWPEVNRDDWCGTYEQREGDR